jgi:hypothetical protein
MELISVKAEAAKHKGSEAVRIVDAGGGDVEKLAIVPGSEMQDGVIEVELSGDVGPNASPEARGFVGVAFRVKGNSFECFYLRPTNGRADDQVRRNHSTQYISMPGWPWQKLRKEFPEKYESYVDLQPGEWTKVRIEVKGTTAKLFVHGAPQPVLIVSDLKQPLRSGPVGLWIGPGTVAHFRDLKVDRR